MDGHVLIKNVTKKTLVIICVNGDKIIQYKGTLFAHSNE